MANIIILERLQEFLLKYVWISGRIGRLQLGLRLLGIFISFIVYAFCVFLIFSIFGIDHGSMVLTFLTKALFSWFILCAIGQRIHDIGYSAWWSLLYCIPVVNLVCIAVLLLLPGNKENKYGMPPMNKNNKFIIITVSIIIFLFGSISIIDYYSSRTTIQVKNVTYTDLLQDMERKQVYHVVIFSDNTFRGKLKTGEEIWVELPADHSVVINTLRNQNIDIKYEPAPEPPWWSIWWRYFFGLE